MQEVYRIYHGGGVGVVVLKDGKILTGKRTDNGLYCGAGGHIEKGESPLKAAIRETEEEFGITPINLKFMGQYNFVKSGYGMPYLYICTQYEGKLKESNEMTDIRWEEPKDVIGMGLQGFKPFVDSVEGLYKGGYLRLKDGKPHKKHIEHLTKLLNCVKLDEDKWITMNGTAIKVEDGQTPKEAGETFAGVKELEREHEAAGFKVADDNKVVEYRKKSNEVFATLSDEERKSIEGYTTGDFAIINSHLNGKEKGVGAKLDADIENIDRVIDRFEVTDNLVAFRGTAAEHYEGLNVGDVFTERGFYSTSLERGIATEFLGEAAPAGNTPIMAEVRVPTGSNALFVGHNGNSGWDESELLIARNTRYRVVDRSSENIVLEIVQ